MSIYCILFSKIIIKEARTNRSYPFLESSIY